VPRLLVLTPHPDDEAYAFAGAIALAAKAGWKCHVECASAGERGKRHDGGEPGLEALGRTRLDELAHSCARIGAQPPNCWHLPDGGLSALPSQSNRLVDAARALVPDLVLTLGPDGAYGHPDHLALYRWTSEAWDFLGEDAPPLLYAAFPKGLFVPQWEKCIGMMGDPPHPPADTIGVAEAPIVLNIEALADTKLAAIAAHRSQLPAGDPHALFPPGIVAGLLREEWYVPANGRIPTVIRDTFPAAQ
jgi:LmbE family N-acetylglucosaminyl deacetylase